MLLQMLAVRMEQEPALSLHLLLLPQGQASGGSGLITAGAMAPGASRVKTSSS